LNPGYIKGYVPGVRENGGQYTHAAVWTIMAFAALGDRRRTWELLNMINPVNHSKSATATAVYKVEPYVMAADVYEAVSHAGRGGWTWYTGSAGWMYQLIIESFLGLHRSHDRLTLVPCLPQEWKSVVIHYRYLDTNVSYPGYPVGRKRDQSTITVDGHERPGRELVLVNDKKDHTVELVQDKAAVRENVV